MPPQAGTTPAPFLSPKANTPGKPPRDTAPASPGYFGLSVDGSNSKVASSGARMVKGDSSPSAVSFRSAAASPPQSLPFHSNSNPDYEAFRNATERAYFDLHRAGVKSVGTPTEQARARPSMSRKTSKQGPTTTTKPRTPAVTVSKSDSVPPDPSSMLRSPNKRLLSLEADGLLDRPRRDSPASFTDEEEARATGSPPSKSEVKHSSMGVSSQGKPVPSGLVNHGAQTLPEKFDNENPAMVTSQYVVNILESHVDEALVLDLRVSTQYARSRITSALNLCVPTTLLKRSTYNVSRLAETFRDEAQKSKFERWRSCKCIVVYDACSSQLKEAGNCINIIKKFSSEGWTGSSYIIKGGFAEFSQKFPRYVEQGSVSAATTSPPALTLDTDGETIAPVIGGCPMPASATKTAANPFFGNIRQNMDLIGGVGQMQISMPASASKRSRAQLPLWLRDAVDESDNGKKVSDKFYYIEKREQKRMQEALSGSVVYGSGQPESPDKIQIAGLEKGSKNRYNNIWPFEHSRVRLQGVPSHGCDYVNANFVQSSLSNKKFIATQGPIPATFTDFWNMVWQRDIRVIVMLTAEKEGGQVKAHNYWSDESFGPIKLRYLSEHRASLELSKIRSHKSRPSLSKHGSRYSSSSFSNGTSSRNTPTSNSHEGTSNGPKPSPASADQPHVRVRKFALSHESEPFERMREITHLQYSSWPDFGAPAHPAHLLGLVEQCDAVVRANTSTSRSDSAPSNQRPVLVHCSAGCGRTGTFCTVDSVIDILKAQKNFKRNKQRAMEQARNSKQFSPMDIDSNSSQPSPQTLDVDWLGRDDIDFIEKTVEEFRMQRLSMVQSLRQFVLCYETVLEWLSEDESPQSA